MPQPRERDSGDKIKEKGSGRRPTQNVRRQMTAKLRRELTEQKRADRTLSADAQAVDQAEQASTAILAELGRETEQRIAQAIRQPRERTDAIKGEGQRPQKSCQAEMLGTTQDTAHAADPMEK